MTDAEMVVEIQNLTAQVEKIGGETDALKAEIATLNQKVADLEAALAASGNVAPEVQTAFDALKAQVAVVDGKVTDITPLGKKAAPPEKT